MNSMERVLAVVSGKTPDRVPFLLTSREFGLKQAGMKYEDCYKNPDGYVNSQLALREKFGLDGCFDIWCTPAVDEALGARMEIPEDDPPWIPEPFILSRDDLKKMKKINPLKDGLMPYLLDVVKRLRKALGNEAPVIAWASQPFRTACMLRGSANLYLDLYDDPDFVKELLEITTEACTAYGKALVDAGADIICTSNPVANMDCISLKHFEEFSHPYTTRMFGAVKKHGAKATEYHTCGKWDDRFDLVCAGHADIIHCDKVNLAAFKARYSDRSVIMGNVRSVTTLLQGTPAEVSAESIECLRQGAPGGRFILSADCAVPRDTPAENVAAMAEAVRAHGAYPLNFR